MGPQLTVGNNTIVVEVATSLINQVRAVSSNFAGRASEPYGLLGPVTLTPYGQAAVR